MARHCLGSDYLASTTDGRGCCLLIWPVVGIDDACTLKGEIRAISRTRGIPTQRSSPTWQNAHHHSRCSREVASHWFFVFSRLAQILSILFETPADCPGSGKPQIAATPLAKCLDHGCFLQDLERGFRSITGAYLALWTFGYSIERRRCCHVRHGVSKPESCWNIHRKCRIY